MRTNKGFSLVELMIVVAIIGILAAIAIPNMMAMQLKSKRAEVPGNVDGIKTAEMAYDASFDGFVSAGEKPRTDLDKEQASWTNDPSDGYGKMGWEPDGKVRGSYQVAVTEANDFTVTGKCDVDNDDAVVTYTATKSVNATLAESGDASVY